VAYVVCYTLFNKDERGISMNLFSSFTSNETKILLMAWAEHHPYLFTLVEIATPSLWVILAVAGLNSFNGVLRKFIR
jgi:hypothetical protein